MNEPDTWLNELLRLTDEERKMTDKQLKIVQAAVEIFSEKGFSATSTSEIAQKAGVAEGTIFRHYKTKKELLLSIVAPMMTKLVAPVLMKDFHKLLDAPHARFEDFLRAVLLNRMDFARKHLPIIKIMLNEIPFHPELKEQFIEHVARQTLERIGRAIERFQADGQIMPLPPFSVIRLAASVILGHVLFRYLLIPEYEWDDERDIEHTVQFIMRGLSFPPLGG